MNTDKDSVTKILRTVWYYFVTERRQRNYNANLKACVYPGDTDGGNGVGCAVGCLLTERACDRLSQWGLGSLGVWCPTKLELEVIYSGLGLKPLRRNRILLRSLQDVHDKNDLHPLHERMAKKIRQIAHNRRIPMKLIKDDSLGLYSKLDQTA